MLTTKDRKEVNKRNIVLVDEYDNVCLFVLRVMYYCIRSGKEVSLTLWRGAALSFDCKNVGEVLLVRNSSISDFNGVSLNGGEITVNPAVGSDLKQWWTSAGVTLETSSLSVPGVLFSSSLDKNFTLQEALENIVEVSNRGEYYTTMATITEFR